MKFRILLISAIVCCFSFNVFANPSNQNLLVKIEIKNEQAFLDLQTLPVTVHFISKNYVLAVATTESLAKLEQAHYNYSILDKEPWTEPYYWITLPQNQKISNIPSVGNLLYQGEREAIVKVPDQSVMEFKQAGFNISVISSHPLPIRVPEKITTADLRIEQAVNPIIGALVNQVSESYLVNSLQRLQDFRTRHSASDSVYPAGQWVYDQFKNFGYQRVEFDTLTIFVSGQLQRNVIAKKVGTVYPNKLIVLGGHYDSIVHDGTDPLVWAPGVDDNGTGTVAVLEAARILANIDLETTVLFACWAAEEQGLYGSTDWVHRAVDNKLDIMFSINFDMIGNLDYNDPLRDLSVYSNEASMSYAELMSEMARLYTTLEPQIRYAGGGSDHVPFMQNGFHFVYGEEGDFSPNWHRYTDTIDNVDIPYFREVVQTGLATLTHVAGPPATVNAPVLTYQSINFDDDNGDNSVGNNNHYLDPGETIELFVKINNFGELPALGVTATLQSDNPHVTINQQDATFGDIAAHDSAENAIPYVVAISPDAPNDLTIFFKLIIEESTHQTWENIFWLKTQQPEFYYVNYSIEEVTGDGDNIPEPGETCDLFVNIQNNGLRPAADITSVLKTFDPYITLTDNEANFSEIPIDSIRNNESDPFTFFIEENTQQHTVDFYVDFSEGEGYYQKQVKVSILIGQGPVLLVADDGSNNNSHYYIDALNELGIPVVEWNIRNQGTVPVDTLVEFSEVIWFMGMDASVTLSSEDQANLSAYLDQGGNLLVSSDFLGYRIGNSSFYSDYLHAKFISTQTQLHTLRRVEENPVTKVDSMVLGAAVNNWPTEIDPLPGAFSILTYDPTTNEGPGNILSSGTGALAVDNGIYKVVYCSFSLEAVTSQSLRAAFLNDILSWFNGAPIDLRAILSVKNYSIDDDSLGGSLGDGDGFINPSEQVELSVTLANAGALAANAVKISIMTDDEFITIIDSTANVVNIPEFSCSTSSDNLIFQVDDFAPNRHEVLFKTYLTDSLGNRWADSMFVTIQYSNTITGCVVDAGTGQGIAGADVWWTIINPQSYDNQLVGNVETDEMGNYSLFLPIQTYQLAAYADGYIWTDAITIELPPDTLINFSLFSPTLAISPDSIVVNLNSGETYEDSLIFQNANTGTLFYSLYETDQAPESNNPASLVQLYAGARLPLAIPAQSSQSYSAEASSTPPDETKWKLKHIDEEDPDIALDLFKFYVQNDEQNLFFKQTVHHPWTITDREFIYVIFLDTDLNPLTGLPINVIGADYAVTVGDLGDLVLRWIPSVQGFNPISGNATLHHVIFPHQSDSLEIGIRLSQINEPEKFNMVNVIMAPNQDFEDVVPKNGLYYIPYATYDAEWLEESALYGEVGEDFDTIYLKFETTGLSSGTYSAFLVAESNQPNGYPQNIPIRLNVDATSVNGTGDLLVPKEYALQQNYPNPFSSGQAGTVIKYQLPDASDVTIIVYNVLGQEVASLVKESKKAGYFQYFWNGKTTNGRQVTSGIYFYKMTAKNYSQVKKMLIMR